MKTIKHGHDLRGLRTRTYQAWASMRQRCNNSKREFYKHYGGRGIIICERWNDFRNFLEDMGECPQGLTLDRINNDGNYKPTNCRWATRGEQIRNSRQTKLTPLKVQIIKKLLKESQLSLREIGNIFNVTRGNIMHIKKGRRWGSV